MGSMIANLLRFIGFAPSASSRPQKTRPFPNPVRLAELTPLFNGKPIPRYPDKGLALPAATPALLMESQAELADDLRRTIGLTVEEFDRLLAPVLLRYAAFVGLLPASQAEHHAGPGGLLRHGIEVATFTAKYCNGVGFANDVDSSLRRHHKPRWVMAAVYAGLMHDIAKPMVDVGAISPDGQQKWNPHGGSLFDWLTTKQLPAYYIYWVPGPRSMRHNSSTLGLSVALDCIGKELLRWMGDYNCCHIIEAMCEVLSGSTANVDHKNPIRKIVSFCDAESCRFDAARMSNQISTDGNAQQRLAARFVRLLQDVIKDSPKPANTPGALAFQTTLGTFTSAKAMDALSKKIISEGHAGIPSDPWVIVDYLAEGGVVEVYTDGHVTTKQWKLDVDVAGATTRIELIKVTAPHFLFGSIEPPPPIPARLHQPAMPGPAPVSSAPANVASPENAPQEDASQRAQAAPAPAPAPAPASMPGADPSAPATAAEREVVDRRARLEEMERGSVKTRGEVLPASFEGAQAWLQEKGVAGAILNLIATRANRGDSVSWGRDLLNHEGRVFLAVPGAFGDIGTSAESAVGSLVSGCVVDVNFPGADRANAVPFTLELNGQTVIALTEDVGEVVARISPPRAAVEVAHPGSKAPKPKGRPERPSGPWTRPAPPPRWEIDRSRIPEKPTTPLVRDEPLSRAFAYWAKIAFWAHMNAQYTDFAALTKDMLRACALGFARDEDVPNWAVIKTLTSNICGPALLILRGTDITTPARAGDIYLNPKFHIDDCFLNPPEKGSAGKPEEHEHAA
jgi:hypothetical protein